MFVCISFMCLRVYVDLIQPSAATNHKRCFLDGEGSRSSTGKDSLQVSIRSHRDERNGGCNYNDKCAAAVLPFAKLLLWTLVGLLRRRMDTEAQKFRICNVIGFVVSFPWVLDMALCLFVWVSLCLSQVGVILKWLDGLSCVLARRLFWPVLHCV